MSEKIVIGGDMDDEDEEEGISLKTIIEGYFSPGGRLRKTVLRAASKFKAGLNKRKERYALTVSNGSNYESNVASAGGASIVGSVGITAHNDDDDHHDWNTAHDIG